MWGNHTQSHMFGHLVPSWWCCLRKVWSFQEWSLVGRSGLLGDCSEISWLYPTSCPCSDSWRNHNITLLLPLNPLDPKPEETASFKLLLLSNLATVMQNILNTTEAALSDVKITIFMWRYVCLYCGIISVCLPCLQQVPCSRSLVTCLPQ